MPPREALKDAPVTEQGNGLATDPALPFVDDAGIDTFNGSPSGPSESNIGDAPASADKPVATRESRSIPDLLRGSRVATGVTIASGFFAPFVGAGLARATTIRSTTATYAKAPQPQRVSTNLNPDEVITSIPGNLLPDRPISTRTVSLSSDTLNVQGDCTAPNYYTKWFDSPNGVDTALCDGSPETVSPRTPNNSNYTGFQSELNSQASLIESSTGNANNTQRALNVSGVLSQSATLSLECPPPNVADDNSLQSITVLSGNTAQLNQCPADPPVVPDVRTRIRYSHQVKPGGVLKEAITTTGDASNVTLALEGTVRYLRYLKAGSTRKGQVTASNNSKLRVWNLGKIDRTNSNEVDVNFKVSKHAKYGSRVCPPLVQTIATNENSSYARSRNTLQKVCSVVKKHPSIAGNPGVSSAFLFCAKSVTASPSSLFYHSEVSKHSAALKIRQSPIPASCRVYGVRTTGARFLLMGNDHKYNAGSEGVIRSNGFSYKTIYSRFQGRMSCTPMPGGSLRLGKWVAYVKFGKDGNEVTATAQEAGRSFRQELEGTGDCR